MSTDCTAAPSYVTGSVDAVLQGELHTLVQQRNWSELLRVLGSMGALPVAMALMEACSATESLQQENAALKGTFRSLATLPAPNHRLPSSASASVHGHPPSAAVNQAAYAHQQNLLATPAFAPLQLHTP